MTDVAFEMARIGRHVILGSGSRALRNQQNRGSRGVTRVASPDTIFGVSLIIRTQFQVRPVNSKAIHDWRLLVRLIRLVAATAVLVVFVGLAVGGDNGRPDILFIAIDDLNDYVSPLENYPGVRTPNFDRLAACSVTFTCAYCAAPACHPCRVAVLTGVHPFRSGLYRNLFGGHGPRWRDESPVLKDTFDLSQHCRNHGYHVAGAGKLFHTLQWTPGDSENDPTLSELTGIPVPGQCDGVLLVCQLKSPGLRETRFALTSFQFAGESVASHTVNDSRYRFIRYGNRFEELYDQLQDPHKFTNRPTDPSFAEIRARLAPALPESLALDRAIPQNSRWHLRRPN